MDDLIQKRDAIFHSMELKIKAHEKELEYMKNETKKINEEIYKICNHVWVTDRPCIYEKQKHIA